MTVLGLVAIVVLLGSAHAAAQERPVQQVDRSKDRGAGLPLSMFGSYINRGELIVYPFFEY